MKDKRQEVIDELKGRGCPICDSETHFSGECESVNNLVNEYENR